MENLERLKRVHALTGALAAAATPQEIASAVMKQGVDALSAAGGTFTRLYPRDDGKPSDELVMFAHHQIAPDLAAKWARYPISSSVPSAVAIRTGRSIWIESRENYEAQFKEPMALPYDTGVCALPLRVGNEIIGAIAFTFDTRRQFSPEDRALMETLASQSAQAFARAVSYERELVAMKQLEALNALAEGLSAAMTIDDVANVVIERGMQIERADTCSIYSFDESQNALVLVGERGSSQEIVDRARIIRADPNNPVWQTVAKREPMWIESFEQYSQRVPQFANIQTPQKRARAFWAFPLVAENRPVGLIGMGFYEDRQFPLAEREFVETFCRHCAEAMLRAQRLEAERTARTLAESSQASLATTLRSIGDAVIATDANGAVTIMNHVAEKLTGWTENEALGRPLDEVFVIVNEHTREPVESPVKKVLELGTIVGLANHTVLIPRSGGGGSEIPIDDSGAPIQGPSGRIEGVILVFRDVTDKKAAEARRNLLEDATHALAESLDYEVTLTKVARMFVPLLADWVAIDIADEHRAPGASKRLAVAHVDPAKIAYATEIAQKYPSDPDAATGVPAVLRTGKSQLYPVITDEMLRAGARDEEHLRISLDLKLRSAMVVPLTARGRTLGAMTFVWAESGKAYTREDLELAEELARRCGLAIDNARLYVAEQQARQTADIANRAKDEFLATVSHELRTPLNAILGWAKMMSSANLDATKQTKAVATIERNAVAMAQLIEDLLDISRIISGKMRLEVQQVDLAHVIASAIESVRPAADAKEIRLSSVLDNSSTLNGDPTRLQQVVWNLLSNAVKFTAKGGRIDVVLRRTDSDHEITVADTGRGFAPRFLPHVFQPFRQEDNSHTRSRGGLGLGLAITRQLVELHGGRIEAYSEGEGKGATFTVHLPIAAIAAAHHVQQVGDRRQIRIESNFERPPQLKGLRVLVIDDEEDARQLVKAVLDECACIVTTVSSVAEALALLTDNNNNNGGVLPDVIVSDIGMPNQDGYDLIRQVRALPSDRGGNIPAAALTAYAHAEDRRRVLNAGYSMHIPKPVEPAELVAVILSLTRYGTRT